MTYLDNAHQSSPLSNSSDNKSSFVIAVIPAYNEAKNIRNIIESVQKYVSEIIVVDDGSTDETFEEAKNTKAKVLRIIKNKGKGAALKKGLYESFKYSPDIIVTIDADGQHDPADIPKLTRAILENEADIVIGSRFGRETASEIPLRRGVGLSFINILNKSLIRSQIRDSQSGFRAYNKRVYSIITDYDSSGYGAETEQLAQAEVFGVNILEVPVVIKYKGLTNTSKKNSVAHGAHLVSTILKIAVEQRPLLFFGLGGIIFILLSTIPLSNLLTIFNDTRYFSIPLALIVLGLVFMGTVMIGISFVLYVLKRIRQKINRI